MESMVGLGSRNKAAGSEVAQSLLFREDRVDSMHIGTQALCL